MIAKTNLAQRIANFDIEQRTLLSCYKLTAIVNTNHQPKVLENTVFSPGWLR